MRDGILGIPDELKDLAQWVVWKYVTKTYTAKDGTVSTKKTKIPFNPANGQAAKVNDPLTWETYELACAKAVHYDGIGFMFTSHDPFVGIDLDHCLKNGVLSDMAYKTMKRLASYAEKSPSGEGIHIIVTGMLPEGQKGLRTANIEVYDRGRYFTMTGHSIQKAPIQNGQAFLDELLQQVQREKKDSPAAHTQIQSAALPSSSDDEKLLINLFRQRNGDMIRRLYEGENAKSGDCSRDDLYFCWLINFANGNDFAQTDRIFRHSGRMRPKWDTVHFSDGKTYGQRTLERSFNFSPKKG